MKKYIILLFIIGFSCFGFAQPDLKFHTLSPKGGLSYDGILDIKQDKRGFMWMLLENNLFRFDGYTYKSFKSNFRTETDSLNTLFRNITVDKKGDLYISTNYGLYKFNYNSDTFSNVLETPIMYVYIDSYNVFWLSTSTGLARWENNKLVYPDFEGNKYLLHHKTFCENGKDLYVFSRFGQIYRYNRNKRKFEGCVNINSEFEGAHLIDAKTHNNELWILTSSFSLLRINLSTYDINYKHTNSNINNLNVRCLYVSEDGSPWIGTMNGLYILNPSTSQIRLYQHNQSEIFSIPHNSIWTISQDNNNNIWLGTYMGSVVYVNLHDTKIFDTHYLSPQGLNKVPVSGFADDEENLWISTEGGGLNVFHKKEHIFSYFQQDVYENSLSSNYTKALVKDNNKNIWISTFRGGLDCYNPNKKHFTHYKHDPADKNSLLFDNLRKIILEPDSGLWIVYLQHTPVFSFFSFKDKQFTHYSIEKENENYMANDYIYDINRSDDNKIWLLTSHFLHAFDIISGQFTKYTIPSANTTIASTLCMDHEDKIWIGTFGNELLRFDTKSQDFKSFSNIFQGDIAEIYSINHSNDGVWMGTNDGLYFFNTQTEKSVVFNASDGTQGNVYYPLATAKGEDGLLYFGGAGGFTIVNPQKISFNPVKPKTIISDFYIDNESVLGKVNSKINTDFLDNSSDLILSHKHANFGFKISSDNYLNADKNQFKYRLKNFDNRWILADATSGRTIHYSKIPPGKYFFEMQAANNDGIWGEISSVKIIRKQIPWQSTPALIAYFTMFCLLLYYLINTYKKRKQLELQHYLDQVEKEKREEIHRNQLQFFTNISHDLKTPLALIMATVNRMREEGMKEYYYRILNSNSERLMRLLGDILDLRRIQNNQIKLDVSTGNINQFIHKTSADFQEYAIEKEIDFRISADEEKLTAIPFDKDIVEKIVMNLLNNSFKYTPKGGCVSVQVNTKIFKSKHSASYAACSNNNFNDNNAFQIVVSDTGIGIAKDSIKKVFDRFYRVKEKKDSSPQGTGIGLALVKDLVLLHHGKVTIYSTKNIGTDIVVQLPISLSYYIPEEIQTEEIVSSSANATIDAMELETPVENSIKRANEPVPITKGSPQKIILIAEDNIDLKTIIKLSLQEKYKVIDFDDAAPALEYLKEEDVDLIVSDIMMPQIDGITFCKSIKTNISTSHIPFVLLTAKSGVESMLEGTESGADLYFEKPIDLSLLKAAIANIFKQQEVLREHYVKNYFADVSELTTNKEDARFLTQISEIINKRLDQSELDVNTIASDMMMSRSKLYSKVKTLTGKSIVEFILSYRLRQAAKLLVENHINIQEAMFAVGIESQSYFTNAFKKEFGMTPTQFTKQHKVR